MALGWPTETPAALEAVGWPAAVAGDGVSADSRAVSRETAHDAVVSRETRPNVADTSSRSAALPHDEPIVSRETAAGSGAAGFKPDGDPATAAPEEDHLGLAGRAASEAVAAAGELRDAPDAEAIRHIAPTGAAQPHTSTGDPEDLPVPEHSIAQRDDPTTARVGPGEASTPASSTASTTGMPTEAQSPLDVPVADRVRQRTGADGNVGRVSRETSTRSAEAADEPWPKPSAQKVLVVANQKGGVGKTTSAVNLATALAQHGARVLVIDLDPQGNASTALGIDHRSGTASAYDVLVQGAAITDIAVAAADVANLDCVPATIDLAGAEIELVAVVARESRLRKALDALTTPYDYIFIDCPPSLGLLTVNALVAAREVLIPIQCEFYALEGLSQLLRNIELVRAHLNETLHVSTILLTMYDGRTRLADQVATEVRNHFGELVLSVAVPRSVRISEAPGYGQSVLTYDPSSRGARAYSDAARELAIRSSRSKEENPS